MRDCRLSTAAEMKRISPVPSEVIDDDDQRKIPLPSPDLTLYAADAA